MDSDLSKQPSVSENMKIKLTIYSWKIRRAEEPGRIILCKEKKKKRFLRVQFRFVAFHQTQCKPEMHCFGFLLPGDSSDKIWKLSLNGFKPFYL